MKKIIMALAAIALAAACSPQFHLDFLGKADIQEVVLVRSAAREKILVIDIEGAISAFTGTSALAREGDILSQVYYRLERAAADRCFLAGYHLPGGPGAVEARGASFRWEPAVGATMNA
jgi:hypothetical protein